MSRVLIKGLIVLGVFLVGSLIWVVAGRHISLILDRIKTVSLKSLPATPLTYDGSETGGTLQIADLPMSTQGTNSEPFPLRMTQDAQRRDVLTVRGKSFLFAVEPGDEISFKIERSMMSWPTPFDFNFMTGVSPSWRRHLYYILRWKKPTGSTLKMVWRYEQYFYGEGGWTSGFMTREGSTGLIQVEVTG